jgi:hypothetical protein
MKWKMLVYLIDTENWNILWCFGNLVVIWYTYFPQFWYIVSRKIWQPWFDGLRNRKSLPKSRCCYLN